jgi:hypothetical protein
MNQGITTIRRRKERFLFQVNERNEIERQPGKIRKQAILAHQPDCTSNNKPIYCCHPRMLTWERHKQHAVVMALSIHAVDETQNAGSGYDSWILHRPQNAVEEADTTEGGIALSIHSLRILEWLERRQ